MWSQRVRPDFFLLFSHQVLSDSLHPMDCSTLGFLVPLPSLRVCPNSRPLNGDAIQLSHHCRPLLLPSIFPTSGSFPLSQLFASGGQNYWSFNFSISPSKEYSGLISFKIDWFDLLAFQGTFKSLLQYHSLKE